MTHEVTGLMPAPDRRIRAQVLAGLGIVAVFGVGIAVGVVAPSALVTASASLGRTTVGTGDAIPATALTRGRIAELQAAQVGGGGLDLASGPTLRASTASPIILLAPATIAELVAAQAGGGGLDAARGSAARAHALTPGRIAELQASQAGGGGIDLGGRTK